jgi:hypothetical protein
MHPAKADQIAPQVFGVASATAKDGTLAAFSLLSPSGPINFSMTLELLGELVSHALKIAQDHANSLGRLEIPGGAVQAIEIIPETITVSHGEVSGIRATRLVVIIGDLSLAFVVDAGLFSSAAQKLAAPSSSPRGPSRIMFPTAQSEEIKLPIHRTPASPMASSALPLNWAHLVGFIVVLWGDFELKFDEVIACLNQRSTNAETTDDWRRFKFGKRRSMFLKLWRELAPSSPSIISYVERLCSDAASLHAIRNLLVHGRLHGEIVDQEYVMHAQGTYKDKLVSARVGRDEIATLHHDISHLCGRMDFLIDPDDSPMKPQPFSSDEKALLQNLLAKVRPSPPTPSKP